jgi:hypothetical protein
MLRNGVEYIGARPMLKIKIYKIQIEMCLNRLWNTVFVGSYNVANIDSSMMQITANILLSTLTAIILLHHAVQTQRNIIPPPITRKLLALRMRAPVAIML